MSRPIFRALLESYDGLTKEVELPRPVMKIRSPCRVRCSAWRQDSQDRWLERIYVRTGEMRGDRVLFREEES